MRIALFARANIALAFAFVAPTQAVLAQVHGSVVAPHCKQGYIWREAFIGDVVCVEPRRRHAVLTENAQATRRARPSGGIYGPDTCLVGYVWRGARPTDHVCVLPISRDIVARENISALQSQSPCAVSNDCIRGARIEQREVNTLRQRLAERRRDLAEAKDEERKAIQQMREEDEKWMREHPGLGRSTLPSITDNVSPIEQDIRQMEAALKKAELEIANTQSQIQTQERILSKGK